MSGCIHFPSLLLQVMDVRVQPYSIRFLSEVIDKQQVKKLIDESDVQLSPNSSWPNVSTKHICQYRCGIAPKVIEILNKNKSFNSSFTDDFYFKDFMTNNIWVKKRIFSNNQEEWIIKFICQDCSNSMYCEVVYDENPFQNSEVCDLVATCKVNRTIYSVGLAQVNVDRIEYTEGDLFCCCLIDNVNHIDDPNLLDLILQNSFPIRNSLFEFLFRYNRNLYLELEKYLGTSLFQTCILEEQYVQMEKDGLDMYLKRLDIIQGTQFCEEFDSNLDEIYNDETKLQLVIQNSSLTGINYFYS